jgi:Tol biopolymer transport system component
VVANRGLLDGFRFRKFFSDISHPGHRKKRQNHFKTHNHFNIDCDVVKRGYFPLLVPGNGGSLYITFRSSAMWNRQNSAIFGWIIVGVLGILLLAGCGHNQEPAAEENGLKHTKIAFVSYRDGNAEIYVINPDGAGQENLTDNPAADTDPSWSPDGRRIAFTSDRDGNAEIYVMNADGTDPQRLTSNSVEDGEPCWSPDGRRIAFYSHRRGAQSVDICIMNVDGSGLEWIENPRWDKHPSWSPDGKKIAFQFTRDGAHAYDIYVVTVDGGRQSNLTNHWQSDEDPSWSPDGKRIAFTSSRDSKRDDIRCQIYVMNADGTGLRRLTNTRAFDRMPSWSPDGKKIVFASNREQPAQELESGIYIMNADGTDQKKLIDYRGIYGYPAWSPFLPPE